VVACVLQGKTFKVFPLKTVEWEGLKPRYGRQLKRGSGSGCLQPAWYSVFLKGKIVIIVHWKSLFDNGEAQTPRSVEATGELPKSLGLS
jgi:hypothetical protein